MAKVYLRQGDDFVAMRETPYEAETVLQELLAEHPELLFPDDERDDRGLLLVRREAPLVDDAEQLRAGWLDHLLVDADGIPTLVEVKRSSDARIRREVVGQLLDYASNAAACWQDDAIREWFEAACERRGEDPAQALTATFADAPDPDAYWQRVRTNLAAGRLRLVFVADEIPATLRRIVEFLNGQMQRTEVLAVEVRQYVDEVRGIQTIVPRVLGQTAAAEHAKGRGRTWDRESVLEALEQRHGTASRAVGERLMRWADERGLQSWYGSGSKDGSFKAGLEDGRRYLWPFTLYTYGRIEICFLYIARRLPFSDATLRDGLRVRLNEIPRVDLPPAAVNQRPAIDVALLTDEATMDRFLGTMDWAFAQLPSGTGD